MAHVIAAGLRALVPICPRSGSKRLQKSADARFYHASTAGQGWATIQSVDVIARKRKRKLFALARGRPGNEGFFRR
jgi:hypothetical protein